MGMNTLEPLRRKFGTDDEFHFEIIVEDIMEITALNKILPKHAQYALPIKRYTMIPVL